MANNHFTISSHLFEVLKSLTPFLPACAHSMSRRPSCCC